MEVVFNCIKSEYIEIISLEDLDNIHESFKKFLSMRGPLEIQIFVINESISSNQLSKLKNFFNKINICSFRKVEFILKDFPAKIVFLSFE